MVLVSSEAGDADPAGTADLDGTDVLASLEAGDGVLPDSALAGSADAISAIRVALAAMCLRAIPNLLARASFRGSNSGSSLSSPDGNQKTLQST